MCNGRSGGSLKVGIIVDNPKRDLKGCVLLASFLVKRGCVVVLIPMYVQGYEIPLHDVDIVVVNYVRVNNIELLRGYKSRGISVVVLDTEGGILSEDGVDSPAQFARSVKGLNKPNVVDLYIFWGERVAAEFAKIGVLSTNRIRVTGCPRYDFCYPPFAEEQSDVDGPYVLVNTNYSAIAPAYGRSIDSEKAVFLRQGWDVGYVEDLFRELLRARENFTEVVCKLAKKYPSTLFLLRPHPFEDQSFYVAKLGEFQNIEVKCEGDVLDAISGAFVVLHLNCGSAVDAVLAGCPPVNLDFLNTDVMCTHAPLPRSVSYNPSSYEQLETLIALARDGDLEVPFNQDLAQWFYPSHGAASKMACDYICSLSAQRNQRGDILARMKALASGSQSRVSCKRLFLGMVFLAKISPVLGYFLRLFSASYRSKYFTANEVIHITERITRAGEENLKNTRYTVCPVSQSVVVRSVREAV